MGSFSLSLKVVVISTAVLIVSLFLKISVPLVHDFSVNQAPLIWSSLISWLKPPYLYVIINCIIITIAAFSRSYHKHDEEEGKLEKISAAEHSLHQQRDHHDYSGGGFHHDTTKISTAEILSDRFRGAESTAGIVYEREEVFEDKGADIAGSDLEEDEGIVKAVVVVEDGSKNGEDDDYVEDGSKNGEDDDYVEDGSKNGEDDDYEISRSMWEPPKRSDSSENLMPDILSPAEKPLVSSRFGHRKIVKASPEGGRALRVSKPRRHETLENTWKAITEGRAMPLTRHVKKSETLKDTWENHGRQFDTAGEDLREMKKSRTFKDRTNCQLPPVSSTPSPASGRLRKEPSLSQDELNRRVEAFISNFNEQMRLQRQESLNQYKEMISRG